MRLLNIESYQLETFLDGSIPPYAILSHTWGREGEELTLQGIEEWKASGDPDSRLPLKIRGCCKQTKKDGLAYVWIDTCCIDNTNSVELGEAINSMYRWYQQAAVCYAYLSDIPGSSDSSHKANIDFGGSRWFTRGWTLQELLAPKKLYFYDSAWSCLGTKGERSNLIEKVTGIPRPFLLGLAHLGRASIAQRMSWAATRVTTKPEDIAYCLLGIFDVTMPMIYGEGGQAFVRLQREIMAESRDDSILAWGLEGSGSGHGCAGVALKTSEGILATSPADFLGSRNIIWRGHNTPSHSLEFSGGSLLMQANLLPTLTNGIFVLLNSGPESDPERVVAIPLEFTRSNSSADEYERPKGRNAALLPKTSSPTKSIRIQRGSRTSAITDTYNRLYIDESDDANVELIEVEPPHMWDKATATIEFAAERIGAVQRVFARFRSKDDSDADLVVIVEYSSKLSPTGARCHAMSCSRTLTLSVLVTKFPFLRQGAFGKQSAYTGTHSLLTNVRQQSVAGQSMLVLSLTVEQGPTISIHATSELEELDLKYQLLHSITFAERTRRQIQEFQLKAEKQSAQLDAVESDLSDTRASLAEMQAKIQQLTAHEARLLTSQKLLVGNVEQTKSRENQARELLDENLTAQFSLKTKLNQLSRRHYDNTDHHDDFNDLCSVFENSILPLVPDPPEYEESGHPLDSMQSLQDAAARIGHQELLKTLLSKAQHYQATLLDTVPGSMKNEVTCSEITGSQSGSLLHSAIEQKQAEMVEFLLSLPGVDVNARSLTGRTPLISAAIIGEPTICRLLLDVEAIEADETDYANRSALWYAVENYREDIVRMLLPLGVQVDRKDKHGISPLMNVACLGQPRVFGALLENTEMNANLLASILLKLCDYMPTWIVPTVTLVLSKGFDINARDDSNRTILWWASLIGNAILANYLVQEGAVVDIVDHDGITPLCIAIIKNRENRLLDTLLHHGASPSVKDLLGMSPFLYACKTGNHLILPRFLERGASPSEYDNHGRDGISHAAENCHPEVIDRLLNAGAIRGRLDDRGRNALSYASQNGHESIVRQLINAGFSWPDNEGKGKMAERVATSLPSSSNVSAVEGEGETALGAPGVLPNVAPDQAQQSTISPPTRFALSSPKASSAGVTEVISTPPTRDAVSTATSSGGQISADSHARTASKEPLTMPLDSTSNGREQLPHKSPPPQMVASEGRFESYLKKLKMRRN